MNRRIEQYGESTDIEHDTLTDGSVAHNVLFRTAGPRIEGHTGPEFRFACGSEARARALADALEANVCWSEVA